MFIVKIKHYNVTMYFDSPQQTSNLLAPRIGDKFTSAAVIVIMLFNVHVRVNIPVYFVI